MGRASEFGVSRISLEDMSEDPLHRTRVRSDLPRRLRMSSREIGIAVALTCAAALHLIMALTGRTEKASGTPFDADAATLIRQDR